MWTSALLVLLCSAPAAAQDSAPPSPSAADLEFFERRVRPVLVEHCLACHDPAQGKVKGGLDLSSAAGWRKGGLSGPAIVPGDLAASLVAEAVRYEDEFVAMPPTGKLAEAHIETLLEWIQRGAPDPRDGASAAPAPKRKLDVNEWRDFWAYTPLADPVPPAETRLPDGAEWSAHPIDRFVLAGLSAAGLTPSPRADRRTLIRRVSLDLVGLPPTPEEVAAFLDDDAPDAWEKVIDRLLAMPQYGERWGRHWLDLARYSDSNGLDENLAFGHAWRYRDYVVRAFNDDKPYDQFVREQLAGDLLPATDDRAEQFDRITATCFLTLGPKMLAEQDKEKLRMDVVDEQVDLVGRVFMGQTIGCARCHDHKFDPLPTRDYYALAGIFRSTSIFENYDHVSRWRERTLETDAEREAREAWRSARDEAKAARDRAVQEGEEALRNGLASKFGRYLAAGQRARNTARFIEAERAPRTNLHVDSEHWGDPRRTVLHTHKAGLQFAEWDVRVTEAGAYRLSARYAAGESRPMRLMVNGAVAREDAFGEVTGGFQPTDVAWREVAELELVAGLNVLRVECGGSVPHLDVLALVPTDVVGWPLVDGERDLVPEVVRAYADELAWRAGQGDSLFAVWDAYQAAPPSEWDAVAERLRGLLESGADLGPAPFQALVHGAAPASLDDLAARFQAAALAVAGVVRSLEGDARKAALAAADTQRVFGLLEGSTSPTALAGALGASSFPREVNERLAALDQRLAALAASEPPMPGTVMAAIDEPEVVEVPVHVRGSHLKLEGDPVPRGFLSVLDKVVPWEPLPADASGRLALAEWLTRPDHPLTARVLVNRVWQHHFGMGLVASPSNFGTRGATPTHPELLDWLARRFVASGWSLKALHRLVLTSEVWQQSVSHDALALERDPTNELLWRQNRRRLEAEAIRDSLLAVSGLLDRTVGGTLLSTRDRGYVTNDQSSDAANYDAPRRSIYLPIIRNAMYPFFGVFDYGDPSVHIEQRPSTTVATQALFLMNSPLALDCASALAGRVAAEVGDDTEARLQRVFALAYGRAAAQDEVDDARSYLAALADLDAHADAPTTSASGDKGVRAGSAEARAWRSLCQALLSANEFVFVD
ncbi:MAG: DUF1553 domain-containing protein [Planctomycetota bacterium]